MSDVKKAGSASWLNGSESDWKQPLEVCRKEGKDKQNWEEVRNTTILSYELVWLSLRQNWIKPW